MREHRPIPFSNRQPIPFSNRHAQQECHRVLDRDRTLIDAKMARRSYSYHVSRHAAFQKGYSRYWNIT